ncbi:hypothetical protein FNV43_RR14119 [Rhamnella rubrinervis]|uniref:3'-5' exonuclease domain-containing protein n=1 Tax=Rhamnella rubrinervis TaxID=2594499 RepID=A0A8K0MG12_9ROSA|nr:hypothetical protein FNV43_RR14119 [Rhamnella rubrinervis]
MDSVLVDVKFCDTVIQTTVTSSSAVVDRWISRIQDVHYRRLSNLVVGLDIEWLPYYPPSHRNPVSIMQICVGRRCLIFQLLHADSIPESLTTFLANPCFTFVGVGVEDDANKLLEDYNLHVGRTMDLADTAAAKYEFDGYKYRGLKKLAKELIGREMPKPIHVTLSAWDTKELSTEQIEYASIDAYMSFELGLSLKEYIVADNINVDHASDSAIVHPSQCNMSNGSATSTSTPSPLSISNQLGVLNVQNHNACNFCNCNYCAARDFPALSSSVDHLQVYEL